MLVIVTVSCCLGPLLLVVTVVMIIIFIRALMAVILRLFNGGQLITVNCCGLVILVV